mmetsp:Transcript_108918/g.177793  ORF Transcript_108918/g.177793 Transcript_108918/m.177793 type:complete len:95 (+) Transcript_108918:2-286(+)
MNFPEDGKMLLHNAEVHQAEELNRLIILRGKKDNPKGKGSGQFPTTTTTLMATIEELNIPLDDFDFDSNGHAIDEINLIKSHAPSRDLVRQSSR